MRSRLKLTDVGKVQILRRQEPSFGFYCLSDHGIGPASETLVVNRADVVTVAGEDADQMRR